MLARFSLNISLLGLFLAGLGANSLNAQAVKEPHLSGVYPVAALVRSSGFLHGYTHGYEDGFHVGNIDYHVQRLNLEMNRFKLYRQATRDYADSFGNKKFFKDGYQAGFRAAYLDATSGRSFRLLQVLQHLQAASPEMNLAGFFDDGWSSGYTAAGQTVEMPDCLTRKVKKGEEFCSGFNLGFALGTADVKLAGGKSGNTENVQAQKTPPPITGGISH